MKIALFLLLLVSSMPSFAQDDVCGGASLDAMSKAQPEKDPAMQVKMDRLQASLRKSHEQCLLTLRRAQQRDERLGIASVPRPPRSAVSVPTPTLATANAPGSCSVVSSSGKPCVQKVSEQLGRPGQPDQVVFENSCANTIDISVLYGDASRGLATVKPSTTSTLLCKGCGGVKSTEAACR